MEALHQPGELIGDRYRIINTLGQGGMGITYQAEDLNTQKQVAIKTVFLSQINDWKVLELFEREAKVLANLNHPAIPNYLDYFYLDTNENNLADRRFYLVQELVVGESLATLVERGWHAREAEVIDIAIQVLKILNYLHLLTPPVIHRDIKPQNIIRCSDGQVYLVDFGAVQDVYRNTLSLRGTFVGTFGYMPPEQFRGQTFFASDLYSLGATLIFVMTHRSPADLPQKRMKIDFRSHVAISDKLAAWLDKMLEPAIEDRFHSAKEALAILQQEKQLQPNLLPTPSLPTNPQPIGSRIVFRRNQNSLLVKIPSLGWNIETINLMSWAMVSSAIALFFSPVFLTVFGGLGSFLFSAIIGTTIFFWLRLLWSLYGCIWLEIKPQVFHITWKLFQFQQRKSGRTENINRIEVTKDINSQGKTIFYCTLWHGVTPYKFGQGLTSVEKDWLAQELFNFIDAVK